MKSIFPFKPKTIIAVLLLIIVSAILSFLTLNSLNLNIIHLELYNYGLTFSPLWANEYWKYLYISFISIVANLVLAALSLISLIIYTKKRYDSAKILSSVFAILCVFTTIFSIAIFGLTDSIVNGKLYSFGLQFSRSWFNPYQWYSAGFVTLQIIIMALSIVSFSFIFFSNKPSIKIGLSKITFFSLLAIGAVLIGLSIIYNYFISLFAGLGLVFWGTVMTYVSGEQVIKKEVLEATSLSYLSSLSETLNKLGFPSVTYFPSQNLNNNPKKTNSHKTDIENSSNPQIINEKQENLIYPPDNELYNLFENTLGTSFSKGDYSFFERVLPKLLVDDLELTQNVKIEAAGDIIKVTLDNPFDSNFFAKAKDHTRTIDSVGIPLSSAIAYALANSTGKPVMIKNHRISQEGKTVEIEYVLLSQWGVMA